MSLPMHVGIVSLSTRIKRSDLMMVSAAIQKQVTRDFGPLWGLQATVSAYDRLEDVPLGYWRVTIVEDHPDIPEGASGIHLDDDGQPFALVLARQGWGITTSHEILEMLADPYGKRLVAGDSPIEEQGRVRFLVEVCDPSESNEFGYWIDGVLVSDFYTPNYFDPVGTSGVRYSFSGAITEPRQVLPGGYLSWMYDGNWYQLQYFGDELELEELGPLDSSESWRSSIDQMTNVRSQLVICGDSKEISSKSERDAIEPNHKEFSKEHAARGRALMAQIERLTSPSGKKPVSKKITLRSSTRPKKS